MSNDNLEEQGYSLTPVKKGQQPAHNLSEITYKGKTYELIELVLWDPKAESLYFGATIAPESLREAYTKDSNGEPDYINDDEVRMTDEQIFEYHPDEFFETPNNLFEKHDVLGIINNLYDDIEWKPVYNTMGGE